MKDFFSSIVKRNGTREAFNSQEISAAIAKAGGNHRRIQKRYSRKTYHKSFISLTRQD
jgi:transcriptional regulator NrdR family protein